MHFEGSDIRHKIEKTKSIVGFEYQYKMINKNVILIQEQKSVGRLYNMELF